MLPRWGYPGQLPLRLPVRRVGRSCGFCGLVVRSSLRFPVGVRSVAWPRRRPLVAVPVSRLRVHAPLRARRPGAAKRLYDRGWRGDGLGRSRARAGRAGPRDRLPQPARPASTCRGNQGRRRDGHGVRSTHGVRADRPERPRLRARATGPPRATTLSSAAGSRSRPAPAVPERASPSVPASRWTSGSSSRPPPRGRARPAAETRPRSRTRSPAGSHG